MTYGEIVAGPETRNVMEHIRFAMLHLDYAQDNLRHVDPYLAARVSKDLSSLEDRIRALRSNLTEKVASNG